MASIDERSENNWRIRVYAGRDPGTGNKRYVVEKLSAVGVEMPSGGLGNYRPR